MLTPNESVLADIVREPIFDWYTEEVKGMLIVAAIAGILLLFGFRKLARKLLEYIGVFK